MTIKQPLTQNEHEQPSSSIGIKSNNALSFSTVAATPSRPRKHHHHHHHAHHHSSSSTNTGYYHKQFFYPLHRSLTDEESYNHKPSPITRFVAKLLSLGSKDVDGHGERASAGKKDDGGGQVRPPLTHKSHSTTSITKGESVISSASSLRDSPVTIFDWQQDNSSSTLVDVNSNNNSNNNSQILSSPLSARDALVSASTTKRERVIAFLDAMDPPKLVNRRPDTEPVLSSELAEQLRPYLPRRYRLASQWSLVYSLDQHGTSLMTLYRLAKANRGPCILAIKDADDHIFGAFLNETLRLSAPSYYGTGECFLWKQQNAKLKVYPWTGKNEYMILTEPDFFAIGGGDG
ncbi:TLD-domain-containing protein, partial [Syncephalastrum racemosum]